MKLNVNLLANKLIWICVTAYFALIPLAVVITEDSGMGKYLLLIPLVLLLIVKLISTN